MGCLERALCYIRRKKMKSVLLLLLFLVINSMVLGTLGIRKVSLELAEELRKNAESKITLESMDVNHPFEETAAFCNKLLYKRLPAKSCIPYRAN